MSLDVTTLAIKVASEGVGVAAGRLDQLRRSGEGAEKATQRFSTSTKVAFAAAGVAAVALAGDILKVGSNFELSMAKVGGVMRATDAELAGLTATARKMGEDTEWSASQAASALEFLGMAGLQAGEAITALPEMLDLATAGQIDLGRASDIATNAMSAFQLKAVDLAHVNDVLVATITSSNTNMEQLAEAMKYSAPLANALGYEINELSGYIGVLGNVGIQGSMAGTQLVYAMQRVGEVFSKYGVSTLNADGSTKKLVDAIELLQEKATSTADIMDIFGERGGKAILSMVAIGGPAIRSYLDALEHVDGTATKLAETMRDTTSGAMKEFASVIESIKIDIFTSDAGQLKDTIREMTDILRDNKQLIIDTAGGLGQIVLGMAQASAYVANGIKRESQFAAAYTADLIGTWDYLTTWSEAGQQKLLDSLNINDGTGGEKATSKVDQAEAEKKVADEALKATKARLEEEARVLKVKQETEEEVLKRSLDKHRDYLSELTKLYHESYSALEAQAGRLISIRQATEEFLKVIKPQDKLDTSGMDQYEARVATIDQLLLKEEELASIQDPAKKIQATQELQKAWTELAKPVSDGTAILISQEDAADDAAEAITRLGEIIESDAEARVRAAAEVVTAINSEKVEAEDMIETVTSKLQELDDAMSNLTKEASVTINDGVSAVANEIKASLLELKSAAQSLKSISSGPATGSSKITGVTSTGLDDMASNSFSVSTISGGTINGSFASGVDKVPRDGVYYLHRNEAIVPAGAQNNKDAGITIHGGITVVADSSDPRELATKLKVELDDLYRRTNRIGG